MQITREEAKAILLNNTNLGYGVVIEGESTEQIKEALNMAVDALDTLNRVEKIFNNKKHKINTKEIAIPRSAASEEAFEKFIENARRCSLCK